MKVCSACSEKKHLKAIPSGAYTGFKTGEKDFVRPLLGDFCPLPLALKLLLFYIKSTTIPYVANKSLQLIIITMYPSV